MDYFEGVAWAPPGAAFVSPCPMLQDSLPTRATLILRLRNPEDDASWSEFVEIYTPLLFNYCLKRGLSSTDAADVVQDAMRSVSMAMRGFEYDPAKGKFKSWLFTVVRNALRNYFRKQSRHPVTAANTQMVRMIEEVPNGQEIDEWERDYQRKLLNWAMEKVKPEFAERIWSAFVLTAVRSRKIADVAEELSMTGNAVRIAKCRVIKRLREKAESVDAGKWEGEMVDRLKNV